MNMKLVKVTDKGQISLPTKMQEATGIHKGDEVLIIESNDMIIIKKLKPSEFNDLVKHSESVAKKLWGSKHDNVWDKV